MRGKAVEIMVRGILLLILAAFLGWAYTAGAFAYMEEHLSDLWYLLQQHLMLVGTSSLLAIAFTVPLGILVTRRRFKKFGWTIVNLANIGQTVPSFAVLALSMSFLGLGSKPAIFALWVYSLLPILRNTIAGIESVNRSVLDAGTGMGMTDSQILWKLELPNAMLAIFAGIRTTIVINVGTAALAFLIGGGLGDPIFTGISLNDTGIMLSGVVPIVLLAVLIDFLLGRLEKVVIPRGLQR